MALFNYFINNPGTVFRLIIEHLQLTGSAILTAILIGVPLGIVLTRNKRLADIMLALTNIPWIN